MMTQIERDTFVQSISAMSEEEMRVALECIPIQYMLDHIGRTISSQQSFISHVKDALMNVI